MKRCTVLFGGGSNLLPCLDILRYDEQIEVVGIIDSDLQIGEIACGYPVIGRQDNLLSLQAKFGFTGGLITVGDNDSRMSIAKEVIHQMPKFEFINAIHPSTVVGMEVQLGKGVVAMAGCIINPGCKIGDGAMLITGAILDHHNELGAYCSIGGRSVTGGRVKIGVCTTIGIGAVIADRVVIGDHVVVGANSLVLRDLPSGVLAYGSPAKIIKKPSDGNR